MVRSSRRPHSLLSNSFQSDRKKQKISDLADNPLCVLATKCGFIFSDHINQPNELGVDQIMFQKDLSKALKNINDELKSNLINGLMDLWKDHKRFCFSLLPTISADICVNSSRGKQQESFVRLLLGISYLQTPVAIALLEKLPEISIDEELIKTAEELGDINLHQRMVDQLRWLDKIYDSKVLVEKVFEIISISDVNVQREIILCVPDFMDESNHEEVVGNLHQLLCSNSQLTSSLMEAFSCINLKTNLLEQVRDSAIKILDSADISNIAGIVKFLQQSLNDKSVHQIVAKIREKVDFNSSSLRYTPAHRTKGENNEKQHMDGIFNAIKTGILFQKIIADEWVKVLETISNSKEQKIFSEYLHEILYLAESFIRSPEAIVSSYGTCLYTKSFICFNNESKQKIVEALVTHITGNTHSAELEVAMSILCYLMSEHYEKICSFAATIKKIGEFIENISVSQMRKLFSVLAKLSYGSVNCDSNDDLQEMIFRNLSSSIWRLKRIGIIGAMMVVATLGKIALEFTNEKSTLNESRLLEKNTFNNKKAIQYLTVAQESVKVQPEALSLFYDELASIVLREKLDPKLLAWISEKTFIDFQNEFLLDVEFIKTSNDHQMQLSFDLDHTEEGGISINILPLIINKIMDKNGEKVSSQAKTKNKLIYLHSHFRLIQVCEKKQNGSLDGIDALLGCPLVLFDERTLETFPIMNEQDRIIVCSTFINAINWLREVINAFTIESASYEIQVKIVSRLKTLVALTETLQLHLVITPNFKLPLVDYSIDDDLLSSIKSIKVLADAKLFKKPKKSKLKKKVQVNDENEDPEKCSDKDDRLFENIEKDSINQSILLSNFPASLRPLDLDIFYILTYKNVLQCFANKMKKDNEKEVLSSNEIIFLLKDFRMKLEHALQSNNRSLFLKQSITKLVGFSNLPCATDVMKFYMKLQPSLFIIFNKCYNYFEKILSDNDGVIDSKEMKSLDTRQMQMIYQLLFDCLHIVLQWDGFETELNEESLMVILQCFTKNKSKSQLQDSAREFFQSIVSFSATVTSIHLAATLLKILHLTLKWNVEKETIKKKIRDIAVSFLEKSWFDSNGEKDKGPLFNTNLSYLIKLSITLSEEPLTAINDICNNVCNGLIVDPDKKNIDVFIKSLPSLTKNTLLACYKCLFEELNSITKLNVSTVLSDAVMAHITADADIVEKMVKVETSIKVFHVLVDIVKNTESHALLGSALKYSRIYLETFLKYAMPFLEKTLRSQKDLVHAILKNLQQSTRLLQHLCGHTKFEKSSSLTAFVPALKKCLETFVYRVKALLAYNNCENAFWLGNLKNRDLKGNEISSQVESSIADDESATEVDEEEVMEEGDENENSESF
ncbi:Fanconi anemia group D2 protein isoform X6 [Hydra vulgaris]|uniref:Fanconi anemia group D2 protein isoform X6 n=1 Tax=Hydra vulgaris TaxID=6087 RepID=A0ABM4DH04_HYDVU